MKRLIPWMFLSPGLLCFALFLLVPMLLTVVISLRVLKTGHWFSEDEARALLLSETKADDAGARIPFRVLCAAETCAIEADFNGKIHTADIHNPTGIPSFELRSADSTSKVLSKAETGERLNRWTSLTFAAPDGKSYRIVRTDQLAEWSPRFTQEGENLREVETGRLFIPDAEAGVFRSGDAALAPGFSTWAGPRNFIQLFAKTQEARAIARVLGWTFVWAIGSVFFCFTLGCLLALVMQHERNPWRFLFRVFLIIPYAIPFFISVLVFKGLMNQDFGLFNSVLTWMGLTSVGWLEHPTWAKMSALMVNTWLGYPYMFLVITGVLQSIPRSHYEAATLEGASRWTTFSRITWPQLIRAMGPLLIGSFAFNMNNFVGIYLLTGGGPPEPGSGSLAGSTDILISYTYRLAFEGSGEQDFGLASAISVILFGLVLVISLAQIYGLQKWLDRGQAA